MYYGQLRPAKAEYFNFCALTDGWPNFVKLKQAVLNFSFRSFPKRETFVNLDMPFAIVVGNNMRESMYSTVHFTSQLTNQKKLNFSLTSAIFYVHHCPKVQVPSSNIRLSKVPNYQEKVLQTVQQRKGCRHSVFGSKIVSFGRLVLKEAIPRLPSEL